MSHSSEYQNFTAAVEHIMSLPKAEILRREAEYKKQADENPNKRGPKPKRKIKSASARAVKH